MTSIRKKSDFQRELLAEKGFKKITDYEELLRLGFKIIKYAAKGEAFRWQKVGYEIVRINYPAKEKQTLASIPRQHYVLYDVSARAIQGVGKNFSFTGKTPWIPLKSKSVPPIKKAEQNFFDLQLEKSAKSFQKSFSFSDFEERFSISEGVVGVSEEGHIVALPPPKKTDPYFMLIFGGRGQGKSFLLNNLEDMFYHKFHSFCANINDIKPEAQTRCLEWEEGEFKAELHRFGEPTVPKPAVYLHPTTREDYQKIHYGEVGFDVSLPLRHLLRDENLVTYNKSWEMKASGALIAWRNLIYKEGHVRPDGLLATNSLEGARKLIDTEIKDLGMKEKAYRVIADIYNTNMIDRASNVSSRWVFQKGNSQFVDSAWNVCMRCDLFPYINTSGIRGELWFALWLRYVIQDIMDFAKKQTVTTQIFMDEIEELLKEQVTRDIIERAIRECRSKKVGLCLVNHNYKYLPETIYSHSTGMSGYKFVFNTGESGLIRKLKDDGLTKTQAAEIPNLKQFECFAFGDFILYDMNGNFFPSEGEPLKIIRIKPPNAQHFGG